MFDSLYKHFFRVTKFIFECNRTILLSKQKKFWLWLNDQLRKYTLGKKFFIQQNPLIVSKEEFGQVNPNLGSWPNIFVV